MMHRLSCERRACDKIVFVNVRCVMHRTDGVASQLLWFDESQVGVAKNNVSRANPVGLNL